MRFDHEPDTDTLTLTMDNGDKVYLPTDIRGLWYTIKPYMPDWGTPRRILVSVLQSLATCVVGCFLIGLGAFSALSVGVYMGPVAGVIVAIVCLAFLWRLCDYVLERMMVTDELEIRRFRRRYPD